MAAHIANALIVNWENDHPDVVKLCQRTVKITDALLQFLDSTQDGEYPEWF